MQVELIDEEELNIETNDSWYEIPYEEKDPLFKESPAYNITNTDINNWNNKVTDSNYVHTDNNYTTTEKTKLAGLSNYDDTEIKGDISDLDTNKADKTEIPTKTSDLTNDSDYVKNTDYATSSTGGVIKVNTSDGFSLSEAGALRSTNVSYATYQSSGNGLNIGKGTLENVLNARIGDISSALDSINGEVI